MFLINRHLFMCIYALFFIKPIQAVKDCQLSDYMLNYNNQHPEYVELRGLFDEFNDWRVANDKVYSSNCELKQRFDIERVCVAPMISFRMKKFGAV